MPESKAVLRKKRYEKDRFTDDGNNVAEGIYQFYRMYKNQMNLNSIAKKSTCYFIDLKIIMSEEEKVQWAHIGPVHREMSQS